MARTLHEITPSPNSVKARIALGYKGLDYERQPFTFDAYPGDRAEIAAASGQPRLPVLRDEGVTIFDSAAIARYLEANYRDTPKLFGTDHAAHAEIERWELYAKTHIGEIVGMVFGQALGPSADRAVLTKANELLNERTGVFEDKLADGEFLVGDAMTAADVACAAPLYLADLTEAAAESNPLLGFFKENCEFGAGRDRTRAWVRRVLSHDPVFGAR